PDPESDGNSEDARTGQKYKGFSHYPDAPVFWARRTTILAPEQKSGGILAAGCDRLVWVTSRQFSLISSNGSYRLESGRSEVQTRANKKGATRAPF
ncbi:MAG: hypothetical protein OES59_03760, partial [Gammaproteobacteria bacterium]|nr:hypothetical protein [Gammaproteobacteria bacterium]